MMHSLISLILFLAIVIRTINFSCATNVSIFNLCELEMIAAAKQHKVPLGILYAVGLTETGYKNSLQPYALNIQGKSVFAQSEEEALKTITLAKKKGIKLIDIGCMQINHYYHANQFSSLRAMLHPATNVNYAAQLLRRLYEQEKTWTGAVARYHASPRNHKAQKHYVCRMIRNMITAGFGQWTEKARKFCQNIK